MPATDQTKQEFGARLKAAREHAQLTQQVVGERFGVGKGTVSAWEAGTGDPGAVRLYRIAKLFGVTADALLCENDSTEDTTRHPDDAESAEDPESHSAGDIARRRRFVEYFLGPSIEGDRAELIRKSGLTKGRIAQFFDDRQAFGERAARSLAQRLRLPVDYFERDLEDALSPDIADGAKAVARWYQAATGLQRAAVDALIAAIDHTSSAKPM